MKLEAIGLKKHFPVGGGFSLGGVRGWIKAVDGVSVQVDEGETLGIVGESGSGKTTLARLFLLLERATAGSLLFDGKESRAFDRDDLARYRRSVQAVFQDPYSSLNPRMRVGDIVAEPLPRNNGAGRAATLERVGDVLELVGLRRASATLYPHECSGGQRQRIGIARAIATQPELLIPVALMYLLVQLLENNLLVPRVQGHATDLSPGMVILLLVVGGGAFGFLGLVAAVPVTAILRELFWYADRRLRGAAATAAFEASRAGGIAERRGNARTRAPADAPGADEAAALSARSRR